MGGYTTGETADLFDSTGAWAGVVDKNGREQIVASAANPRSYLAASGIPFVMPSSGNITSTSGAVTVSLGFDYVIGPSYTFFPIGALYSESPSGWYYTKWTAATLGTVYADVYTCGVPAIPESPTPLTTVVAAYTQVINYDTPGPAIVIPAGSLGVNGTIEWHRLVNSNNSAGTKTFNLYLGGILVQGFSQTTNPKEAGNGFIRNRGRSTAQVTALAAHGDNANVSSITKSFLDTDKTQIVTMCISLSSAADFAIIESFQIRATYGV